MSKLNLHQRIHAVMAEVQYVQKTKKQGMQYSAVMHDDVVAALRPAIIKHGIVVTSSVVRSDKEGNQTTCTLEVTFTNIDNPAEQIKVYGFGEGNDKQDKGPGKAVTYAYKYALLKCFMLETGDVDPDAHTVETEKRKTFQGTKPQIEQLKLLFAKADIEADEQTRRSMAESFIGRGWDEIRKELKIEE